jgi:segregation and condensation protein B
MKLTAKNLHSILFLRSSGATAAELQALLSITEPELQEAAKELSTFLTNSGVVLIEDSEVYQLVAETKELPSTLQKEITSEPLSGAALEVLTIVAYHQPISQTEVEAMRGVGSEQTLKTLAEKELIKATTRKVDGVSLPHYVTTNSFLAHLGIRSLKELPTLKKSMYAGKE